MSLKERLPFAVKHRLRGAFDWIRLMPRDLASAARPPRGVLHSRYQSWYRRRHLVRFFRQLLSPGTLVFDVGANLGEWTDAFLVLGCRVVAVEPQQTCAQAIASRHRGSRLVRVVQAAVGSAPGEATLFLASHSQYATISRGWMDAMIERAGFATDYWGDSEQVTVRTLDDLIDEFGVPAYLKLDVEGSEAEALHGLTQPIALLSFESHGQTPDRTRACVGAITALGDYDFNLAPGEFLALRWSTWQSAAELLRVLEGEPLGWDNVFARLRDPGRVTASST